MSEELECMDTPEELRKRRLEQRDRDNAAWLRFYLLAFEHCYCDRYEAEVDLRVDRLAHIADEMLRAAKERGRV